ncbi:response regulator transcription factor [Clostridium sp. MB40-C1]|uniref:response regulator transcription factor n=1 Tax=Clostridium sp. MB40-C1 TaxID=3070996 RepID=UPI0027E0BCCA|nr:response regulator transcription factor [Clostridium sp. MB40-C1]WMJ80402.1 response regulator transcription factor [Clostridium sp. MB40-C1]
MNKTILIVEDKDRMRDLIADYLKSEGFRIVEAINGEEALKEFKLEKIHLIILDIMIPYIDGWKVCKEVRSYSDVPIIILTARSDEDDKLKGYDLGADEYVTKPFSPKVLVAKTKAHLRRIDGAITKGSEIIRIGNISMNLLSCKVYINNKEINLSPKEYDLLLYMMKNKGIVLSRDTILLNVWGAEYDGDLRAVDTQIKRLREKLGTNCNIISTVRGKGYLIEVNHDS